MIRVFDTGDIAPAGTDGTAVASALVGPINGEIQSIYVKYDSSQAGTIDTVIAGANDPKVPILTLTNVKTSGWYYPRAPICDELGAALLFAVGGTAQVEEICVSDYVKVSWAQADVLHPVRAWIFVEME